MEPKQELNREDLLTDDEQGKRQRSEVTALVANIVAQEREAYAAEVREVLSEFKTPDRSNVPEFVNRGGEPVHRQTSPTDPLYRKMPEAVREIRNPDTDHWMGEWIRGEVHKDRARMFQAQAKLDGLLPTLRLVTDEATPGAAGALAAGTGGALIPRPVEALVMIARDRVAKMRRFASGFTMTRQTHTVPTAAAMTAYMTAESTTATTGEPTFAGVQLAAMKGQAVAIATLEILDDAAVNLVGTYTTRAGGALGVLEDNQFFEAGNGTPPNISASAAGTAYAENTAGALHHSDLVGMYHTLGQVYRATSAWFASSNVLQLMSNVRNGQGNPFWQNLNDPPVPISDDATALGTLLGRPVYEVPFTAGEILLADMSALYTVGTRQGIQVTSSEHVKFDLDQVMWKFTQRFDGNNIDTVAGQQASGITSAGSA